MWFPFYWRPYRDLFARPAVEAAAAAPPPKNGKPLPWGGDARVQVRYNAHLLALYLRRRDNLRSILAWTVLPTLQGAVLCNNWNL